MDPEAVFVLVPDKRGVTVASLGQLIGRVDETVTLDELVTDAGMDSIGTGEDAAALVERVRALNETGDSRAYWNSEVPRVCAAAAREPAGHTLPEGRSS